MYDVSKIYELQTASVVWMFKQYLLKVNDIKSKKGADLLQHLVEYYHAQMK